MKCKRQISPLLKEADLREKPVIIRVNDFDEETSEAFAKSVSKAHETGQKVIPVVIDSYGGQVYSLMSMISVIRNSDLPVATIVTGKAMSCGAVLFSFGEEGRRFMAPESTLMIHDVSCMNWGKIEELKATVKETDRLNKIVYKMMAKNCGKREDYFLKIVGKKKHADWYINAKEAKKHNLANKLKIPSMRIKISVDIDLK